MLTLRLYSPDEVIIRENDVGETAFIIERGKAAVSKENGGERIHIAYLEAGATFGEMSMIDDMPRNATVTAVEETLVREIHRDDIQATMKDNPDAIVKLLKNIFERLREANMIIANLTSYSRPAASVPVPRDSPSPAQAAMPPQGVPELSVPAGKKTNYSIEGMTSQAVDAISDNPFKFSLFPFKIGRRSTDPLLNNHLEINDQAPLQISRHHVSVIFEDGKIGIVDRGSQLGASVDGIRIGGKNSPGPVFFKGDEGILILGGDSSPYRYRIRALPS
jgi:CRP-like cAMP-binding protein